ncbi:MAG: hypothetical protein Q4G69_12880 [Planctomycetia bacterium]|nr:hypothetical protein [Planctomycetia bacterium]
MKKLLVLLLLFSLFSAVCGSWIEAKEAAKDAKTQKVEDPEFEKYIRADDFEKALKSNEMETMLLAARQIAKGEKELGRTCKYASAEALLLTAYQIASSQDNKEAKAQIRKTARLIGKLSIISEFNMIDKIKKRPASHKKEQEDNTPLFTTDGNKEAETLVDSIVHGAQQAVVRRDQAAIESLEKQVQDKLEISDKLRLELINYLAEMKAQASNERTVYKENQRIPGSQDEALSHYWPESNGYTYFCRSLRATFSFEPGGARIIYIYPYSPLRGRLRPGDVITHLDYILVSSPEELEQHFSWTLVDFYSTFAKGRYGRISIFIPEIYYPGPYPYPYPDPRPIPPGPIPGPVPNPNPYDLPGKYRADGHQLNYTPGVNKNFNPVPEGN